MNERRGGPPSSGPLVFLTGASSGIGAALVRHYAHQGATLGLVARRADKLAELTAGLPGTHRYYPVDVADGPALAAAAADFMAECGVPDIVIANAGVSVGTLTEFAVDLDAFDKVLRTNVLGMGATFQPFIAPLRQRGSGRLVGVASVAGVRGLPGAVASVAGVRGLPGAGAYSASKAAAIRYLESLRVELRGSGVKVVTLAPGYIATPMTAVNDYPMPFLLEANEAARRLARAIQAGRRFAVVPWQMGWVARLLAILPRPVFDAVFARAGRKPRGLQL